MLIALLVLVRGFGLDATEAFDLMILWNRNCQPPWSAAELLHKIRSAAEHGVMVHGALLERGRRT